MPIGFPNFITKLNPKEFGNHLKLYSELFTNPIKSWKKAYSQRKTGYDFTILHIIYYSILVLVLFKDFYLTAQLVLLEVLITLIPVLIFIVPFLISKRAFKIRKKWTKLFRVFLVIKFQIIPPFILLILFTKWSEIELLYILVSNGIWIVWLSFILVVPFINNLSFFKKLIWIIMNYFSFLIGFFLIGLTFQFVEQDEKFFKKIQLNTPNQEYQNIWIESSLSMQRIYDKGYVTILQNVDEKSLIIKKVQFATPELALIISQNSKNEIVKKLIMLDSIQSIIDSSHVRNSDKYKLDSVITLNYSVLDSIRAETNKYFFDDLKLYQKAKDSSKYESNKKYFELYYEYLKHYDSLFVDAKITEEILADIKPQSTVVIDDEEMVAYYELSDKYIYSNKNELIELKEKLDNRELKSNFILNLMFYPLEIMLDYTEIY